MAEQIRARLRIVKMEFADPITTATAYKTASFTVQPFTLQEDSVNITQDDLEEDEIKVNELDTPIDMELSGGVIRLTGSFVNLTTDQLKALTPHVDTEGFHYAHSAKVVPLTKAILITSSDGRLTLLPNAVGYVRIDHTLNNSNGRAKFPFRFTAKAASPEWPADFLHPEKRPGED